METSRAVATRTQIAVIGIAVWWFGLVAAFGQSETLNQSLRITANAGDAQGVKDALAKGADPNAFGGLPDVTSRMSPLAFAIAKGDLESVRLLLAAGARVELLPGAEPWSHPLAIATARTADRDSVLFNLVVDRCERLPSPDVVTDYILRPAAKGGYSERLDRLRRLGADFSHVSAQGNCVQLSALEGGRIGLARELVQQYRTELKASQTKQLDAYAPLEMAKARPDLEADIASVLNDLRELGFTFKERDQWNTRLADTAVSCRLPAMARALGMKDEAKLAAIKPYTGTEIVCFAARRGTNKEFALLFDRYAGSTAEARRRVATSALVASVEYSNLWGTQLLARLEQVLLFGADPNGEAIAPGSRAGATTLPIQAAIYGGGTGRDETIDWLLAHGADLNRVGASNGCTALQLAARYERTDTVKHLLAKGSRVTDFEDISLLASVVASGRKPKGLLETLLAAGADAYSKPGGSKSAVELAADKRDLALLRQLDTKRQQAALLDEYTPPKGSPFIGIWSNEKSEFATVALTLNEEGLAVLGAAVISASWLPWKTTGSGQAQVELRERGQELMIKLSLQEDGTLQMSVLTSAGEKSSVILKRMPGRPLTMAEMAAKSAGR